MLMVINLPFHSILPDGFSSGKTYSKIRVLEMTLLVPNRVEVLTRRMIMSLRKPSRHQTPKRMIERIML